ncbi:MAG: glycosyltransferase [Pseudomonadota bacterium]
MEDSYVGEVENASDGMRVFVSWEPSNSRSATLAEQFDAECWFIHYLSLKNPWLAPIKYVLQTIRTWYDLFRQRPSLVFVQNPPVFAPLAVWVYCALTNSRFIIDSHTGVFLERKWRWLSFVHAFVVRRAAVSIVTNEHLAAMVEAWGGNTFIFPDVPVEFPNAEYLDERSAHLVTVVNSFSYDEPLAEVLEAARALPQVEFAVTGDVERCPPELAEAAPENVRFTGFVPRKVYVDTLYSSDAAVVLTLEDHTMQRGAYEAMSLGVPIVTSNWPLLRNTFFKGAQFTDNTASSITSAIETIIGNKRLMKDEVADLKRQRRALWRELLAEFEERYLRDGPSPS